MNFRQWLKLKPKEILGVDIGSSVIKIVQMHKDTDGDYVTAAHITEVPATGQDDVSTKDISTVRAIRECLQAEKIKTKMAVCSVSGKQVAVRHFKFPQLSNEEIEGAVMLEADQVCPFNVDVGNVDYQLIPSDDDSVKGVLVAATNKLIQGKKSMLENAFLDAVLMDVDGLALLNCFYQYQKDDTTQVSAVLNVGSSCTNLAIVDGNGIPFIRDIAYAGNDIINKAAKPLGKTPEQIKELLFGFEGSESDSNNLRAVLEQASQELIHDINGTLRYYSTRENSSAVEKIYVCGGFALAKEFVDILDQHLYPEAVLWNPFDRIPYNVNPDCEQFLKNNGPAMAVATGLAMRSF
ncbi:MAG: type IV pilus assembly protein PilM [Planctomycetota bacterium]